jgi:ribose/xylose/arabinose/galactoside ABC-type transport system permease subunit
MSTIPERAIDRLGIAYDNVVLTLLDNMIWPILMILIIMVAIFVPQVFSNLQSLQLVLWGSVPLGLLVLAESIVLLSGRFDLSIGSVAGFTAIFTGLMLGTCPSCWGILSNPLLGIAIILALGGIIGAINGVLVGVVGINPFLETLAALIILEGAKTTLTTQPVTGLPSGYTYWGGTANIAIGILIALFILFGVITRNTRFGQAVYALGSDTDSARAVGVKTTHIIIVVYVISGALAGLAGLMLTGFTGVVPPNIGEGNVFPAFAGAVVGGISLYGGRGKISGALGGVLLLALIQSALTLSGVPARQIQMINGFVLLIAILLYNTRESIRNRILASEA